jgi:hypothetical protein
MTDDLDDAHELLREEVRSLRASWDAVSIYLRAITNIVKAHNVPLQMGGDIVAPGSRRRFAEAVARFGPSGTLGSIALQERFQSLFSDRVLREARRRLDESA